MTLDLGQGRELTAFASARCGGGAVRAHVLDVREEFARDYILPALQADALYEDGYPLATALGRPLIVRKLVDVARMEGAAAIAHGCSGKANDELRFELGVRALDPAITVLAPARLWGLTPGAASSTTPARAGLRFPRPPRVPIRVDANLWGRSSRAGVLEDPWQESPEDVYTLTRAPQDCPERGGLRGDRIRARACRSAPMAIDMPLVELIESLETIAGAHGVGRIDMIENATAGTKSREIYEAPAAVLLHTRAQRAREAGHPARPRAARARLGRAYADLVYNGRWFSPTREAIDAFVDAIQPRVTGAVRLKLFKGDCRVVGRRSPMAMDGRAAWRRRPPAKAWAASYGASVVRTICRRSRRRAFRVRRRRFASIGGCSKTTCGAASRGRAALARARRARPATRRRSIAVCAELLAAGRPIRPPSSTKHGDEDVHAFVERELVARIGEAGRRLHTGRSRNEQVSVDLPGCISSGACPSCSGAIAAAVRAARRAGRSSAGESLMPSYTHMRRAQPMLVAHFLLVALRGASPRRRSASARRLVRSTSCRSVRGRLPGRATRSTSSAGRGARLLAYRAQQHRRQRRSRFRRIVPPRRGARA